MIRVRAVVAGALAGLALAASASGLRAEPAVPDDTPWTVDDADPGKHPNTIEEILSRDRGANGEDQDIQPPGQDQPDYAIKNDPAFSEDRLSPKLPAQIDTAREHVPDTIRAVEPAAVNPQQPQPSAPATAAVPVKPSDRALTAPPPQARQTIVQPPPVAAAPVPVPRAPVQGATTAPSAPLASQPPPAAGPVPGSAPAAAAAAAPAPQATPAALAPADAAVAQDGHDPSAPPPVAIPAEQVSQAAVGVNGKLYLPLKRYFETKSETALSNFIASDRAALSAFYDKTVGEALWVTKDGYNDGAKSLIAEISKADEWGLASADYKIPAVTPRNGEYNFEDLADAEVKLSLTALEYARHARGDRIDTPADQLSSYIDRKPQLIEPAKLLDGLLAAADKGAYLRSLHPKHPQFELMREKLVQLRQHQRDGTEPEKIPGGPKITPGKEHSQVALVRRRLGIAAPAVEADGTGASETYFDEALARAIMDYKTKRQIEPVNATITDALRAHLNQSAQIDEEKLLANMEQWRWMPDDLGETYVWVNVPEFLVRVRKNDQTIHEERVVTGRYETQTPIFSNRLKTVVFQPRWNVPESIKVNELLPKLRSGGNPIEGQGLVLERNGKQVSAWDVDWNRQDIRNFHIYQPPGDSNVLGVVKFLFPNKHSVYLHDTPSKRLFNEKIRTFSHGCMRVRNPVRLAEVIMAEDKAWDREKVAELIASGPEDNVVALDRPIPVHVTYFTMWVSESGDVQTFPDIYGHEKRIRLGLNGRWEEIEKNTDHLAPADPAAVASREDWGDQDDDAPRTSRRRVSYPQRQAERAAPPLPAYKQAQPAQKKPSFNDFFSNVFGLN